MEIFDNEKSIVFENEQDVLELIRHGDKFSRALEFSFDVNPNFGGLIFQRIKSIYIRQPIKGTFDLSPFPNLEYLQVSDWNKNFNMKGIGGLNRLIWVYLNSYRPKEMDLSPFKECEALQEIRIDRTSITGLNGIEKMDNLCRLYCDNAKDVSDIEPMVVRGFLIPAKPFRLNLSNCKKVDWSPLVNLDSDCTNIKDLVFRNCNDLPTLKFVKYLPGLRSLLVEGTNVSDGDMRPSVHLYRFWHDNKRHYNLKCAHENLLWGPGDYEMIIPEL